METIWIFRMKTTQKKMVPAVIISDENVDGVDSGETNQEDLTEDGMQQNESNADGSEDVIGGTEDAQ